MITSYFTIQKSTGSSNKKSDPIYELNTLIHNKTNNFEEGRTLIQRIFTAGQSLDVPNVKDKMTPVMYAFQQGRYDYGLELMLAGASLDRVANNGWSILIACIREERLPQVKLLVWFNHSLLTKPKQGSSSNNSAYDEFTVWASELRKHNKDDISEIINQCIDDVNRIQTLRATIAFLEKKSNANPLEIAEWNSQLATIYYRQLKIENEFDRSKYAINPRTKFFAEQQEIEDKQFRQIALKYYGSMAFKYFLKAEALYNNNTQICTPEYRRKHFECLHRLHYLNHYFKATHFPYSLSQEQQERFKTFQEQEMYISSLTKPTASQSSTASTASISMDEADSPETHEEGKRLLERANDSSSVYTPSFEQNQPSIQHFYGLYSSDDKCRQRVNPKKF